MTTNNQKGAIYQMVEERMNELQGRSIYRDDITEWWGDVLYEIQELEPVWISVEERLPNTEEWVLWYGSEWNYTYLFDGESFYPLHQKVTHWMSLPKPPNN